MCLPGVCLKTELKIYKKERKKKRCDCWNMKVYFRQQRMHADVRFRVIWATAVKIGIFLEWQIQHGLPTLRVIIQAWPWSRSRLFLVLFWDRGPGWKNWIYRRQRVSGRGRPLICSRTQPQLCLTISIPKERISWCSCVAWPVFFTQASSATRRNVPNWGYFPRSVLTLDYLVRIASCPLVAEGMWGA